MSFTVYFEDGHGKAVDENGDEPVLMEIDEEGFPLNSIADYGSYIDLKPPEKEVKKAVKAEPVGPKPESGPSTYRLLL
ncbi:hypothetical protein G6F57_012568 [Rhizopus arrhizus]|uniref:Uncharacterized protein n=1 Tax=Rhizopus oryzae TaxID=64495 RepID=A0A9P6WYQ6_RHIOR|nr:hypothetical protein G6F24_012053 [Rhizopus arrhizus]KAG1221755.1 hypothetical protein G6F68_020835 [Rhizopus microsporus]KAG0779139.1 hypothetical protein G6F22_010809 [Rhizopus arrhizus]KAG0781166.1 hypothetical protein G6F21_011785 [Rhizopus arrhizus]KAG0805366.1 hypothetical protein G6F20_011963 [Rhizopus arrhizus]